MPPAVRRRRALVAATLDNDAPSTVEELTDMNTLAHWAGGGPGPWILLVPLFWAAVVAGGVVLLRRTVWRRHRGGGHGGPPPEGRGPAKESATDLLARRFAAGDIDEDEYWLRLSVLNESRSGPAS